MRDKISEVLQEAIDHSWHVAMYQERGVNPDEEPPRLEASHYADRIIAAITDGAPTGRALVVGCERSPPGCTEDEVAMEVPHGSVYPPNDYYLIGKDT